MGKRIVPLNVLEQQVKRYQDLLKDKKGGRMPNGSAQFEYNGEIYTLKKNPDHRLGWQAVPAWRESRDASTRRGKAKNQRVKTGSIEQMMVDNIYQEAQDRNLVVDHDIPIQRGGPSNAPWNLKLRTPNVNGSKGNKIGGNYPAEPLIADTNNPLDQLADTVRQPTRPTRDVTQSNPNNSPLAALAEATRTGSTNTLGDTHPLGGSVAETDPLGILPAPRFRTP